MIWLPRTTDNSTYFAQSLEIRGIESRLYFKGVIMGLRVKVFILDELLTPVNPAG